MSSFEAMKWIYWLIGTVGIAGTIALWVFFPMVARGIASFAFEMLRQLLATRMGCALLGAVIAGLAMNYVRASIDEEEFAARTAAFEERQKQRDAEIAAETRAAVTEELKKLNQSAALTDVAVKDFTNGLQIGPPAANPHLVGDDACKLRFIAGLPPCGSERHSRVSGARKRAAAAVHRANQRLSPTDSGIAGATP